MSILREMLKLLVVDNGILWVSGSLSCSFWSFFFSSLVMLLSAARIHLAFGVLSPLFLSSLSFRLVSCIVQLCNRVESSAQPCIVSPSLILISPLASTSLPLHRHSFQCSYVYCLPLTALLYLDSRNPSLSQTLKSSNPPISQVLMSCSMHSLHCLLSRAFSCCAQLRVLLCTDTQAAPCIHRYIYKKQ